MEVISIFEDPNIKFLVNKVKNIVKTKDEYVLEKAYELDGNGKIRETEISKNNFNCNNLTKNCYRCIYNSGECCLLRSELEKIPENTLIWTTSVNKCDAYHPIYPLNIIKSKTDMIDFIINVDFFKCPEDYESYFGFSRKWDGDTGNILETVEEYYVRGGEFENIPDNYPCVINFTVVDSEVIKHRDSKMNWIYIGE